MSFEDLNGSRSEEAHAGSPCLAEKFGETSPDVCPRSQTKVGGLELRKSSDQVMIFKFNQTVTQDSRREKTMAGGYSAAKVPRWMGSEVRLQGRLSSLQRSSLLGKVVEIPLFQPSQRTRGSFLSWFSGSDPVCDLFSVSQSTKGLRSSTAGDGGIPERQMFHT